MFNEAVRALENFIGSRAFNEGAAACQAGMPRHAPMRYGVYSSHWTRGYDHAVLSNITQKLVANRFEIRSLP